MSRPRSAYSLPILRVQDEMGEHAVTAVVATWPGEDGQPEVHFEVRHACGAPGRRARLWG